MTSLGLVTSDDYARHAAPFDHPEQPARLTACRDGLASAGLLAHLRLIAPRSATRDELALVHTREHIEAVAAGAEHGGGTLDPHTYANEISLPVAPLAPHSVHCRYCA